MQAIDDRRYDVKGAVGLALAIGAFIALHLPLISIALSSAAIVVSLLSRRALRENSALAGATVSVLGFVVGIIAFCLVAIPVVLGLGIPLIARIP